MQLQYRGSSYTLASGVFSNFRHNAVAKSQDVSDQGQILNEVTLLDAVELKFRGIAYRKA